MRRVCTIIAVLLAALWLPATQHCGLEAAGILAAHCDEAEGSGGCAGRDSCAKDSCNLLESGDYTAYVATVKAGSPDLVACLCCICQRSLSAGVTEARPILAVTDFERAHDWIPIWQFERRAAWPPRAPSSWAA